LESVKSPSRFNVVLISEAVKRKDIDFAKEVLLEKEGHTLTVKQAQALGRVKTDFMRCSGFYQEQKTWMWP